jgi:hypothetical protein
MFGYLNPEDGGNTFHEDVGELLLDCISQKTVIFGYNVDLESERKETPLARASTRR